MNLDEYNKLNWCDLSDEDKSIYINLYFKTYTSQNTLRLSKEEMQRIKMNAIQGITSDYVAEKVEHDYINNVCSICGKQFKLTHSQIMGLKKDINKLIFCSKNCASKYTTTQWHKEKTLEEHNIINNKISQTLSAKELTYTEEQKQLRADKLNAYWKDMSPEDRSLKNKQSANKSKDTKLKRYGSATYNNRKKASQTNLDKYGVSNPYRLDRAKNKAKEVINSKYGVDYFFENRTLFETISMDRYGTKHPMQNKNVKDKLDNTKYERYGDKNYNNQILFEDTFLKRYGVRRPFYLEIFKNKSKHTKLERYGDENYHNVEQALQTTYARYGKDYHKQQTSKLGSRVSKINKKFAEYIGTTSIEFPIGRYSYDVQKDNVLIEIDPILTHNCCEQKIYGKFGGLDKYYHYNKSNLANMAGYRCIHIFDWDDWEKIKYLLQDKETLYARNLVLKEVTTETTDEFLNEYHLQNTCRGQNIRYGLYKGDELIEVMTFGKPRYNKKYEWELLRLCTHKDYKVVGGAEKLFKHFVQIHNPTSIISYCDYSKFSGDVYERLGFNVKGKPEPSKHWVKGNVQITDNLLRQRGYDQLFNANYGKGTSNEELMLQHGWLPIYDCGQLTFIWEAENM